MADGNIHHLPRKTPFLALVSNPVTPSRQPSFRSFGGQVFCGTARLSGEAVEALVALFQREAAVTGDWTLHDDLCAARDGLEPNPPCAA